MANFVENALVDVGKITSTLKEITKILLEEFDGFENGQHHSKKCWSIKSKNNCQINFQFQFME